MKTHYVVSALLPDSSPLEKLNKYDTEKAAIDRAKEVIELRRRAGNSEIDFYVLKVVAKVGTAKPPIKVERIRK